jgi:hypothetical protein
MASCLPQLNRVELSNNLVAAPRLLPEVFAMPSSTARIVPNEFWPHSALFRYAFGAL